MPELHTDSFKLISEALHAKLEGLDQNYHKTVQEQCKIWIIRLDKKYKKWVESNWIFVMMSGGSRRQEHGEA